MLKVAAPIGKGLGTTPFEPQTGDISGVSYVSAETAAEKIISILPERIQIDPKNIMQPEGSSQAIRLAVKKLQEVEVVQYGLMRMSFVDILCQQKA